MQPYTKIYLAYFGYALDDFVPCECCGGRSSEIHHLNGRHGEDPHNILNIMAICRNCHELYGQKKQHLEFLTEVHAEFIKLKKG